MIDWEYIKDNLGKDGFDINYCDDNGNSYLHLAVLENNYDMVRLLLNLSTGNIMRGFRNNQGLTAGDIVFTVKNSTLRDIFSRHAKRKRLNQWKQWSKKSKERSKND